MGESCIFSIVIPTYNRPERVAACLEAISHLDYPRDGFEVIMIDDGGAMPLDGVIAPFRDQFALHLIRQTHAGVAVGRNTGAGLARGKYLVFTDDDCRPARDWLQSFEERFKEENNCIIGGRTVNALTGNIFSAASQSLVSYLFSFYNANPRDACFLTGSNLAVPTELFRSHGGFDRTFYLMGAEEREFCDRWRYLGLRMLYAPEVIVFHYHALTLRGFIRQHFHYGRGAYHFQQIHAERCRARVEVEPLPFYLGMVLRYPFLTECFLRACVMSLLMCVSQAANAAGYFREKRFASRQEPSVIQEKP
jgi:GT2 family glycosyltransferase